jgi:hypothetical protein
LKNVLNFRMAESTAQAVLLFVFKLEKIIDFFQFAIKMKNSLYKLDSRYKNGIVAI